MCFLILRVQFKRELLRCNKGFPQVERLHPTFRSSPESSVYCELGRKLALLVEMLEFVAGIDVFECCRVIIKGNFHSFQR